MESNQKKKFVCKFCNKRYPCGKSLGGHIRIHQNGNYSADYVAEDDRSKKGDSISSSVDAAGYILRENPKKTRRFETDANNPNGSLIQVCKECGKGFQSLKALCGHMACHSRNYSFDESDDTSEKLMKELVMDDQSDTETSAAPSKRRRSKRMVRYKNIGVGVNSSSSPVPPSSFSSIASDLEQDQEEVALCLMMLSKDSGLKGCLSYVAAADHSSDNNSVVLEAKSTCLTKMRIKVKNNTNNNNNNKGSSCYDDDDENSFMEMKIGRKKHHQQRKVVISSENDGYGSDQNSDSGYFNYGPKKVEDSEVVSFNYGKKLQQQHGSRAAEMGSRFGESLDDVKKGKRVDEDGYESRKRARDHNINSSYEKKSAYNGAQQRRISNNNNNYESGENSFETEPVTKKINKSYKNPTAKSNKFSANAAAAASKKAKTHECPFCSKVFRSGQALGGHKRSHFVGGAEDTTVVIKQQVAEIPMIDLNLPAPVEEEQATTTGFVTW
ncbi:Zinc finger protein ZAT1 [Linum perenne]